MEERGGETGGGRGEEGWRREEGRWEKRREGGDNVCYYTQIYKSLLLHTLIWSQSTGDESGGTPDQSRYCRDTSAQRGGPLHHDFDADHYWINEKVIHLKAIVTGRETNVLEPNCFLLDYNRSPVST